MAARYTEARCVVPAMAGTVCGAGYGRHGVWCLLSEARGVVPPMAGTVCGAGYGRHGSGGPLSARPIGRAAAGMVPPRWAARCTADPIGPAAGCPPAIAGGDVPPGRSPRRRGGGVAGPCRGLAKDAWGRPSSGLPVGRPVWCLLWQARCWPGTVSRVPGGAWERCLSIRDEASAETPEKRYLANEETVRNGSGEWGRENEAWQCLKSGQHGNAEISGNGASGNGASGNGASGNGAN